MWNIQPERIVYLTFKIQFKKALHTVNFESATKLYVDTCSKLLDLESLYTIYCILYYPNFSTTLPATL